MTFSLPQAEDSPTYPAQALLDATDLLATQAAAAGPSVGSGVVSGCAVTPHSSGVDLNVNVASGSVIVAGAPVSVSAQTNISVTAASTHDRRDIVTCNSSGTVTTTAGTPCSVAGWTTSSGVLGPVKPAIPASSVLLAEVYVPGTATSITASNIVAKAAPIGTNAVAAVWATGDQSGNEFVTSSTTDVDVTGTSAAWNLSTGGTNTNGLLSIAAAVGDVLEIDFVAVFDSAGGGAAYVTVSVGGTAVTNPGFYCSVATQFSGKCFVTVTSGMISGGTVACKPRWHTPASTAQLFNLATGNPISPIFSVKNLKH